MSLNNPIKPEDWIIKSIDSCLDYDPLTGLIIWVVSRTRSICIGDLAGTLNKRDGYIQVHFSLNRIKRKIYAHHIAWYKHFGEWPARQIDHRNRVCDDNRIENLRLATDSQNMRNRGLQLNNTTGASGIHLERGKYKARISVNGTRLCLGTFSTFAEAVKVRVDAEMRYFEQFRPTLDEV
jgi:hypothetical protein